MGLDATVYCDCIEKGRLRVSHPRPELLRISENGYPVHSGGEAFDQAHDEWEESQPCAHRDFVLLRHHLGNIARIASVRQKLEELLVIPGAEFPIFQFKVVYSGIHGGDFLNLHEVDLLRQELDRLDSFGWNADDEFAMSEIIGKLKGLVYASLWVGKPISF